MPRDEKYKLKNRRERLDEAIEGSEKGETIKVERKTKPIKKDSYDDDFGKEAEISDLKKKKEELLKGISNKKESEKKEIRKQLRELNDKIMDLENS